MKKQDWSPLDDEELLDEIRYQKSFLKKVVDSNYSESVKEKLTNEYLEILKSLYNEKRRRGIAK